MVQASTSRLVVTARGTLGPQLNPPRGYDSQPSEALDSHPLERASASFHQARVHLFFGANELRPRRRLLIIVPRIQDPTQDCTYMV